MKEIEIIRPDDWHVHFRDEEIIKILMIIIPKIKYLKPKSIINIINLTFKD